MNGGSDYYSRLPVRLDKLKWGHQLRQQILTLRPLFVVGPVFQLKHPEGFSWRMEDSDWAEQKLLQTENCSGSLLVLIAVSSG